MTLNGTVWLPVGPSPVAVGSTKDNGMVTAVVFNPNNPAPSTSVRWPAAFGGRATAGAPGRRCSTDNC